MSIRTPDLSALLLGAALAASAPLGAQAAVSQRAVPAASMVPPASVGKRLCGLMFRWSCAPAVRPSLFQMLFRVPQNTPQLVRAVAFRRRDPPGSPLKSYPPITLTAQIAMGHARRSPGSYSYTLADNRGKDVQIVFTKKSISFPAQPKRASNNYPFAYRFALDKPLSLRSGAIGLMELEIFRSTVCFKQPQSRYVCLDWYGRSVIGKLPTAFGVPCGRFPPAENNLAPTQIHVGNPAYAMMTPMFASGRGSFVRIYGGLRNDRWLGLKLPYPLDRHGAPGCSLSISFDWIWPDLWPQTLGAFVFAKLDLPNDPRLVGKTIFAQGIRFDFLSNALGMATSQAWRIPINAHVDPWMTTLIPPFGPLKMAAGQPLVGLGPVFLLDPK